MTANIISESCLCGESSCQLFGLCNQSWCAPSPFHPTDHVRGFKENILIFFFLEVVYRGLAIVGVVYLPLHVVAEGKGHDKCKNGPVCHKLSAFINRVDVCAARIVQTERNKACFNCRCAAYRGQRYGKIRHSVCLRAFFLFEVYYCPMLFSKNLINVRKHSLFGILHSGKNRNIEPERALKSLKMGLKREIRLFWSVFFIFRPVCIILIKR